MDALILGLRVFVALGAVLGLMWFLQRRLGKGTGRRRADRALTIVSRQSVGQKASVVVVDAAGQRFLLGVTEHAVNVLHTGDIPAEAEEAAGPRTPAAAPVNSPGSCPASRPLHQRPAGYEELPGRRQRRVAGADAGIAAVPPQHPAPGLPCPRTRAARHRRAGHAPLHGSILAGSTWKQAAAALRSGRRN